MTKPKCKQCGKPLNKQWYGTDWATKQFGREPYEVRPANFNPKETQGFYGHYGKDGHGAFCSHKCGYYYALYVTGGKTYYPPTIKTS